MTQAIILGLGGNSGRLLFKKLCYDYKTRVLIEYAMSEYAFLSIS